LSWLTPRPTAAVLLAVKVLLKKAWSTGVVWLPIYNHVGVSMSMLPIRL